MQAVGAGPFFAYQLAVPGRKPCGRCGQVSSMSLHAPTEGILPVFHHRSDAYVCPGEQLHRNKNRKRIVTKFHPLNGVFHIMTVKGGPVEAPFFGVNDWER